MSKLFKTLIESSQTHITSLFKNEIDKKYAYHNLAHTMGVFESASFLANAYDLSENQNAAIGVAALFHDTGFLQGPESHEQHSAGIATQFLDQFDEIDEKFKSLVSRIILATKLDHKPTDRFEEIIKDADCHHLGTKAFFTMTALLKEELKNTSDKDQSEKEWIECNMKFFQSHKFHTAVAEGEYNERKRKNYLKLQKQLKNIIDYEAEATLLSEDGDAEELLAVGQKADRGVETMYRVTLRNHNQLSKIADNKSNIMLSINSIMLSIVLSSLASKLDTNKFLIIPTVILVITCVISIIVAVLATRPKISAAPYSDEAFLNNKFNMLFFGNFYKLPLDKFEWGIKTLMNNERLLYGSLSKDLYFLGLVLAKKYKLLRICYNIFMVGIILSAFAFVIAFTLFNPVSTPPEVFQ